MKYKAESRLPATVLLYLGIGFAAFFHCLVLGNSYFDGDLMNSNHFIRLFLRSNLLQGHFPLWNPHLFGGQPFLASPDFMVCYPFVYPTLLFPVEYGFGVFYFLHFLIAAFGMHFWLRTLKLSEDSCRIGAILFALSGYFWSEIVHPPEMAAYAWTPWWGGALEKVSEKLRPAWAFAAGLAFACLFLAGIFQMTMGILYGGGLYLVFRLLTRRDWRNDPEKDKRLLLAPLFFLWGALPVLFLWIPAWEFLSLSERLHAHLDYATFQSDYSLNPAKWAQFLFPVNPVDSGKGEIRPINDCLANGGYLGPWAFFLISFAFMGPQKKTAWFIGALGTGALLLSFGKYFPVHRWACLLLPGIGLSRAPFRFVFLYAAAGAVLSALGYERLEEWVEKNGKKKIKRLILASAAYGFLLVAAAFWQGSAPWLQLMALAAGIFSIYAWRGPGGAARKRKWVFLMSVLFCLLITGWGSCPSRWGPASNFDYTTHCDALARLKERAVEPERVILGDNIPYWVQTGGVTVMTSLPADASMATGLRNALGYNSLDLDKFTDLYTLPPRTFTRLMAVGSFISGDQRWNIAGFSREDWGPVNYCRNQEPVSFVYAPHRVESVTDNEQRLALMRRPDFDPYETAYFSQALPESPKAQPTAPPAGLEYQSGPEEADAESFNLKSGRPGWVVFSEVMYPGWKAWVDGEPAVVFTANHLFRSLWVPAGRHEVLFRYEPWWWKTLLLGLILWILSVLALAWGPWGKGFLREFQQI